MPSPLGGSRACGELAAVQGDEFDSRIADLVLVGLANYEKRIYDPKIEYRSSDKARLAFVKEHFLVDVSKVSSGQIRISACERRGGSYGGVKDGAVVLDASLAVTPRIVSPLQRSFSSN
jgi:hypothetical protein